MQYKCNICDREFNRKNHLERHLSKKFKCISPNPVNNIQSTYSPQPLTYFPQPLTYSPQPLTYSPQPPTYFLHPSTYISNPPICVQAPPIHIPPMPICIPNPPQTKSNKLQCPNCLKLFSRSDSLQRHLKQCKEENKFDKQLEDKNKELEEKNKKLEELEEKTKIIESEKNKKLEELEEKNKKLEEELKNTKTITITNNTVNNTINNTTNINMVPYGKEDISGYIELLLIISCRRGLNAIPELIKWTHFNNKHPEMQNLYVPSEKNTTMKVYTGQWETRNIDDMAKELYEDKKNCILENRELILNNLAPQEQSTHNKWVTSSMAMEADIDADAQKVVDSIHKRIKNILVDNREIPRATRNKIKTLEKNSENKLLLK
jgi:hypothetical protein